MCVLCAMSGWWMDGPEDAAERFTHTVLFTEVFVRKEIFVPGDFKWLQRKAGPNFATSTS